MMAPVTAVPMPAVPVPMMMPTPMAMMPAHLLGLHAIDLVTRGDSRMRIAGCWRARILAQRKRRERRRLGGHCEGGNTRRDTEGYLQKVPAFHESFPLLLSWTNRTASFCAAT